MSAVAKYALAALLLVHGVAHLPGFLVPWRLMTSPDLPYKTTILSGRFDIGSSGVRGVGLLWLAGSLAFAGAAIGVALARPWGVPLATAVAIGSAILCVVEWPQARIGLIVNVAVLVLAPIGGAITWREASADSVGRLQTNAAPSGGVFTSARLEGAPPPVARYFRRVLSEGQPLVASVSLTQDGEFLVGGVWRPLRATQVYTVEPAGFVWDATIAVAPLLPVYVRDRYMNGRGGMLASFAGVYPVANQAGRQELDAGALVRYVAEAVWFPTALLPGPHVHWEWVSDDVARVTVTDANTTASLEFRFTTEGDVREIFVPDRFAEHDGHYDPQPWLVRCSEYETHAGMRIPVACQVEWQGGAAVGPYWRGRISSISYEVMGAAS